MRSGDRVAMAIVAVLAMWPFILLDVGGWLALWHFGLVPFDVWTVLVSVFPIGIDLVILRVGLIQAAQSTKALTEIQILAAGITTLLRQGEDRDRKMGVMLTRVDAAHAPDSLDVGPTSD